MTAGDALGLWANLPRLRARRLLDEINLHDRKLTADAMYDLVLAATGSQDEAERATKEMMHARLRSGEVPE